MDEEEHEWTDHPDEDEYWLGSAEPQPTNPDRVKHQKSQDKSDDQNMEKPVHCVLPLT